MKRLCVIILYLFCVSGQGADRPGFMPRSMAYVLQADRLAKDRADVVKKLAACNRDLVVVDASYNTETGGPWTQTELEKIRAGKPGRKVMAYMSIGEAEDYRLYWKKDWDANKDGRPDASAPKFLHIENPDWKGNYRVRYWQNEWQQIMLPAIDRVVAQGFDGIYLDIVDAFEFYEYDPATKEWQDHKTNPETGRTYRQDMITWVSAIAKRARDKNAAFLVIPQNASTLLESADYRQIISGIGVEDLFVDGKKLRSEKAMNYVIGFLDKLRADNKPVLVIDYPRSAAIREEAFGLASQKGYTLLLTDRELTTLGESR